MHFSELKQLRWGASGTVMRVAEREGERVEEGNANIRAESSLCSVGAAVNKVS